MASKEHKQLSQFLKNVHSSLRQLSSKVGPKDAWIMHCDNLELLHTYSQKMQELATVHWENGGNHTISRITWAVCFCSEYFLNKLYITNYRPKEIQIAIKINLDKYISTDFTNPIKLLDVGSCYNPFKEYEIFEVIALDLCPANDKVFKGDFLNVEIDTSTVIDNNIIKSLEENFFDVVTFCFVLEYIPDSEQRIKMCEKAYKLLKFEGLLIITTPDSKHVGANAKIMKCWRYTLACMGFSRIKYEKFDHMHCMSFRKSIHKDIAVRWATLHKESYMDYALHIPQDFQTEKNNFNLKLTHKNDKDNSLLSFDELPFPDYLLNDDNT